MERCSVLHKATPVLASLLLVAGAANAGTTTVVSVSSDGTFGNAGSFAGGISGDGRYVAFNSSSTNLVPGDTNANPDIFVRDRFTATTERVSVSASGSQADLGSFSPDMDASGRYVVFISGATNLISGDTNGKSDVYVYDRVLGVPERVSVASDGAQANGHSVGFPKISGNGRYVVFTSQASNLVPNDTNGVNGALDVFVHDRVTGGTERVNVASDGSQANNVYNGSSSQTVTISADGRYVVFTSIATNLVANDTNGQEDVFIHDRQTHTTSLVSVATNGTQGNGISVAPDVSSDGRFVAFASSSSNLVSGDTNGEQDFFVRDVVAGTTERVSIATDGTQDNGTGTNGGWPPAISGNGRYVAFMSNGTTLVSGLGSSLSNIFVRDRFSQTTELVSVTDSGGLLNWGSSSPSISDSGEHVVFATAASNIVAGDAYGTVDVFVRSQCRAQ